MLWEYTIIYFKQPPINKKWGNQIFNTPNSTGSNFNTFALHYRSDTCLVDFQHICGESCVFRDWDSGSDSIRMAHICRSSLGQVISTNQSAYLLTRPPVCTRSANSSSPEWQTLHQPVVWWSFNPDKVHQYQVFRPLGVDLTSFWLCSGKDSPLCQERRLAK